jgi:hypothetical protein
MDHEEVSDVLQKLLNTALLKTLILKLYWKQGWIVVERPSMRKKVKRPMKRRKVGSIGSTGEMRMRR